MANLVSRSDVIGTAAASTVITAANQKIIEGIVTRYHRIWFYIMTSGDIWQQFGVATWRAGRARSLLRIAVPGFLTLTVVAAVLWWSGAITPHIRWSTNAFFLHAEVDKNGVLSTTVDIEVENDGPVPFTLTGVSAKIPGILLLPADEEKKVRSPLTVASGGVKTLKRRVVITDCAAVPHEPQPVEFTYRTWMGSGSVEVMGDSWELTGPGERLQVAWQRGLATEVCNDAVSPEWP
ncbi:hypothetical protein [Streptosporangium sp. NBC_01469]|uniref:hypothetical protein n=1 Tax=Streptosporangium sp. NBC_01469 TaxID=2903898 RepID=UPI002E285651|nr:hypothetical protein [Streptosporangium sp. NBC_01469]